MAVRNRASRRTVLGSRIRGEAAVADGGVQAAGQEADLIADRHAAGAVSPQPVHPLADVGAAHAASGMMPSTGSISRVRYRRYSETVFFSTPERASIYWSMKAATETYGPR